MQYTLLQYRQYIEVGGKKKRERSKSLLCSFIVIYTSWTHTKAVSSSNSKCHGTAHPLSW